MSNTLFPIDQLDTVLYRIGPPDFSSQKSFNTFYTWKYVMPDIDPSVGRNNMLAFLRFLGILDHKNRPRAESEFFHFFKVCLPTPVTSWKACYFGNENTFVSGQGILVIRKILELYRAKGGSI